MQAEKRGCNLSNLGWFTNTYIRFSNQYTRIYT